MCEKMHRCDLHVVVCPFSNPIWVEELMADLREQPVNVHLPRCVEGNIGASRAAGFAMGSAEYVSFADHDDRILLGAVGACIAALDADANLGAVFTGEQVVNHELVPIRNADVSPYRRELHEVTPSHVHGLIVMRRGLVQAVLDDLPLVRVIPEWWLTLSIAKVAGLERVPMVGRLWRHHPGQATRTMNLRAFFERNVIREHLLKAKGGGR